MLHSPKCIFTLANVLHVPHITKSLLYVQKFCRDNHVYFEFHVFMFISRISSPKKFSFSVRVMVVFISSLSLLLRQFLKLFGHLASPRLPTCGIVVWVIQPLAF